ncbi:MAG TPA: iron ABC transporter substrate-binding protein [Solirubrobacteraceae bacterium]|nr:iron ABC transporter substrate-binding protein [Solirubrobacteraceae bacterium]
MRVPPLLALLMALTFLLAACGDDDTSGSTTAATGDGERLTIYSGRDEEYVAPLIDRFKQANPDVDVQVRYGDSAELAATIREEGDRSPADLFFSQDAGALGALQDEGVLAALPSATLDEVAPAYRSTAGDWVGITGRARVLGYDSRAVKESDLPDSVFDLTQPRWKGKVGWAPTNASFQSFVTAMRKTAGEEKTRQWLEDMQANDVQSYEKNSIIRDAVADGEIEVGLINHYYILEGIREGEVDGENYPVKLHFFPGGDVGSLVNVAGIGVLKSAEQGANAQKFTDFLLEKPQQEYFAEDVGEYPLVAGVAQDPSLPPLEDIQTPDVDLADLADLQGTLELLQETGAI